MSESLPIPLPPAIIDFIAKTLDISQEEASTTESFLLFKKHMKSIRGPANVEREDRTIEFDHIKADITIIRPLKHENKILPVILYL